MSKFAFRIALAVLLTTMVVLFFTIGFMNDPQAAKQLKEIGTGGIAMFALLNLLGGAIVIYFLPALIAMVRKHHNKGAIFVLNLLLGWTALGWIAAIVWASTRKEA